MSQLTTNLKDETSSDDSLKNLAGFLDILVQIDLENQQ